MNKPEPFKSWKEAVVSFLKCQAWCLGLLVILFLPMILFQSDNPFFAIGRLASVTWFVGCAVFAIRCIIPYDDIL